MQEAELFRDYWALLRSGMPAEWLTEERAAFAVKLTALRNAEGGAAVQAEEQGDFETFSQREEAYRALAAMVPE